MAQQFRTFKQVVETALSYMTSHSDATDLNPGSVVRSLVEAYSLEAAMAYVLMQSLQNKFSIDKASGDDLDERALDFGITRQSPTTSSGQVVFGDSNLTSASVAVSTLAAAVTAGVSTQVQIQTADYALFPASGTIILSRGDSSRESLVYSSKTGPDLLNLVGLPTYSHTIGETVHKSTVGADRAIASGTEVKTKSPDVLLFKTTEAATLYDGDYETLPVQAVSSGTGAVQNVAAQRIIVITSLPFPTATVRNDNFFTGGYDYETDEALRARVKDSQQALSSSTVVRIETEAVKVKLASTGQSVVTAKVLEPIVPGESTLYINDGTLNYTPSTVTYNANDFLIGVAEAGQSRARIKNWPVVDNSEQLFVSLERGTSTTVGAGSLTDSTKAWTTNQWAGFRVKDENSVVFSIVSNTATVLTLSGSVAPQLGAYAIFNPAATLYPTGSKLTKNTHYIINNTNGEIELLAAAFPTGLTANDCLLAFYNGSTAAYSYYDGLLQEVQKVMNGVRDDPTNYPGVIALGTILNITAPTVVTVVVDMTISANAGVDESTIRDDVKTAVATYINNLAIGDDVLKSSIIAAAKGVAGVYDVSLISPASNIVVTSNQLAKTSISSITVT